ncbi:hypothetical protein ACFL08_02710 [Patescibacteria group bacterium]
MLDILEGLFGSKTKVRMMRFFLLNSNKEFSAADIVERNKLNKNEVRKELGLFEKIKLITSSTKKRKKHYKINKEFVFYTELEKLISMSSVSPQCSSLKKVEGIGSVKLALVSGIFMNYSKSRLDLLLVADNISRIKLKKLIENLEAEVGKEIRYMVLNSEELSYRLDMLDRFLIEFFKSPHSVVINKIPRFKNIVSGVK